MSTPNDSKDIVKADTSYSERFTNAVIKEFSANNGEIAITPFQKKLCQNYFIKIDMILKDQELRRMKKNEQYRDALSYTWDNVNLQKLANDVIIYSAVGLDPTQPNHINPVPMKNNNLGKYDIAFIMGYRGIELKSKKYGFDIPDDVVVELVYANDTFKQIKKDINNKIENYEFVVTNNFDRGEIVGGFYYHCYFDKPEKNKLRVFTRKDIEKRKPDYAAPEFWGGEKDKWVNGQKQGTETVEGWFDEMAYKTVYRAAYNAITIDSEKIDATYLSFIMKEGEHKDLRITNEIKDQANATDIKFEDIPNAGGDNLQPVAETPVAEKEEITMSNTVKAEPGAGEQKRPPF